MENEPSFSKGRNSAAEARYILEKAKRHAENYGMTALQMGTIIHEELVKRMVSHLWGPGNSHQRRKRRRIWRHIFGPKS